MKTRGSRSRKKTIARKINKEHRSKLQKKFDRQRSNPKPGFENKEVYTRDSPNRNSQFSNKSHQQQFRNSDQQFNNAHSQQSNPRSQFGDNNQRQSNNQQFNNKHQFSSNNPQQNRQRAITATSSAGFADFIKKFTTEKIVNNPVKIGNEWYLPPEESPFKGLKGDPFIYGTSLGFMFGEHFVPSASLVEMLAKAKPKTITVNDKAEWLFICGRDILKQGIIQQHSAQNLQQKDFVVIKNQNNEALGIGMIDKGGEIKNIWDLGNLIRREHGLKKQGKKREF